MKNIVEVIAAIILIPIVVVYRLLVNFIVLAFVLLLLTSPFILVGFLIWMIAR